MRFYWRLLSQELLDALPDPTPAEEAPKAAAEEAAAKPAEEAPKKGEEEAAAA